MSTLNIERIDNRSSRSPHHSRDTRPRTGSKKRVQSVQLSEALYVKRTIKYFYMCNCVALRIVGNANWPRYASRYLDGAKERDMERRLQGRDAAPDRGKVVHERRVGEAYGGKDRVEVHNTRTGRGAAGKKV